MTDSAELFRKLTSSHLKAGASETISQGAASLPPELKKRGRPATGKRSDPNWIGRTYYIRKETDLDVETELLQLKREGIDLDKSELVDSLLAAWVKWRHGENIDFLLAEITPIVNFNNK